MCCGRHVDPVVTIVEVQVGLDRGSPDIENITFRTQVNIQGLKAVVVHAVNTGGKGYGSNQKRCVNINRVKGEITELTLENDVKYIIKLEHLHIAGVGQIQVAVVRIQDRRKQGQQGLCRGVVSYRHLVSVYRQVKGSACRLNSQCLHGIAVRGHSALMDRVDHHAG